LQERVKFYGFVSEDIKYQLLARTHILLLPSKYEAWGMTVQEAGIVGTPTIAYQTAGMQSVIIHGKSGLIVPPTPLDLAKSAVYAVQDLERYVTMQTEAQNMAKQYSWDVTADLGLRVLQSVYQSLQKQKPVRKK
jgi:glycosyltransferase involved in cell wall biosynthesis